MTTEHPTLQQEIRAYAAIESDISLIESNLRHRKQDLQEAEQRVIDAFVDSETTDITVDGRKWKPTFDTRLAIDYPDGADEATKAIISARVVDWVKNHGGEDLVQPSMHHARRDSFLRQKLIDDEGHAHIPEELVGLVKTVDLPKLTKRKVG